MNADLQERARVHLKAAGIDAWVVCDFRGSNPVFASLLGEGPHLTRRAVQPVDQAAVNIADTDAKLALAKVMPLGVRRFE